MNSPYVAIFDCDHVPTRSFLQMTMGWFLRDPKLAMLQTPHHFYSPDPFERNLGQFRVIPNEGELFYGIVQDGNDFWNAIVFLRLLRRAAPYRAGRYRRHRGGDRDRGCAHFAAHADERLGHGLHQHSPGGGTGHRAALGARGPAHSLGPGHDSDSAHRQSAFCAGSQVSAAAVLLQRHGHFLYAVPRLIFLTAPLIYLLLNHTNIPGYWAAILAYALPHLTLSNVTNSRIQGEHRHSFWNEIYETVLSPYILLPTMMALINPKLGKFNVTAKGGVVKRTFFDTRIAQPFLIMLLFNIAGLLVAIPRFFIWDRDRPGTVLMNVIWCCFNIVILGVCTAVAREMRQLRTTVRISVVTPVMAQNCRTDGSIARGNDRHVRGGTSIRFNEAGGCCAAIARCAWPFRCPPSAPICPPPWSPLKGPCCGCVLKI